MQQFVSLIISELLTYNQKHEMLTRALANTQILERCSSPLKIYLLKHIENST